jgi:hypothetical protein
MRTAANRNKGTGKIELMREKGKKKKKRIMLAK